MSGGGVVPVEGTGVLGVQVVLAIIAQVGDGIVGTVGVNEVLAAGVSSDSQLVGGAVCAQVLDVSVLSSVNELDQVRVGPGTPVPVLNVYVVRSHAVGVAETSLKELGLLTILAARNIQVR